MVKEINQNTPSTQMVIKLQISKEVQKVIKVVSSAKGLSTTEWITEVIEREAKNYKSLVEKIVSKNIRDKDEEVITG